MDQTNLILLAANFNSSHFLFVSVKFCCKVVFLQKKFTITSYFYLISVKYIKGDKTLTKVIYNAKNGHDQVSKREEMNRKFHG